MIDEVDSFLRDRGQARQSWEVTMVNEMLTRMEAYPGIFIASTNLMDNLDPAALRRFDLKVGFSFLKPQQSELLFHRYTASLGLEAASPADLQRLHTLGMLTPGDFAAVVRQHRFRPLVTPAAFVAALAQECALKAPVSRSIGFLG